MSTLLIAMGAFVAYIVAYNTYGRWLSRKIFRLDASAITPSVEVNDGRDYVPTRREIVFGHHFTSIAGTGPIVGPAIAVFWGWLPAPVWFLLGPTALMIVVPAWALLLQLFGETGWVFSSDPTKRYLLTILGLGAFLLQAWMVIETLFMWKHAKGVAPDALPPAGSVQRGVAC